MRISTTSQFSLGVFYMQQKQDTLQQLYQQISSQQRVINAADDPAAASQAVEVTATANRNDRFVSNASLAYDQLSISDSTLQSVSDAITSIRELAVQAGKPTLSTTDRAAMRSQLVEDTKNLVGLLNATSAEGNYIFGGTATGSKPFDVQWDPAIKITYQGNTQRQEVAIGTSRTLALTEPGNMVGGSTSVVPNLTTPLAAVPASPPAVPNALPAVTVDPDTFTNGNQLFQAISRLDQLLRTGPNDPASTAAFDRMLYQSQQAPVPNQFQPYQDFANRPDWQPIIQQTGSSGAAYYSKGMEAVLSGLDAGFEQVVSVNTVIGSRMNAAQTVKDIGGAQSINYSTRLEQLVGLGQDAYVKAISDYQAAVTSLQASQQTFSGISKLSLFNYL
ncbi:flagellar hook-associated protein FlgL [Vogesella sp. LIG4]|uniref:flagellar hook-associated protein FlgL n=1 Tax=Vogesella sp. LIG4 TaxID=1192162 RepID=UPI00081F76FB|nr:flagellar hook-associated protein FlgL [Vogesella sp. LIG4]SCK30285.1 flagellar hook-associated protein 3 FlgL [Vogesella sp. LIG4]